MIVEDGINQGGAIMDKISALTQCLLDRIKFLRVMFEQTVEMTILWLLREISEPLNLAKVLYMRFDEVKQEWIVAVDNVGSGHSQMAGTKSDSNLPYPDAQLSDRWIFRHDVFFGWDAVYVTQIQSQPSAPHYYIAVALGKSEGNHSQFTKDEKSLLNIFIQNFLETLRYKLALVSQRQDALRAYVDDLTGLPNRRAYSDFLLEAGLIEQNNNSRFVAAAADPALPEIESEIPASNGVAPITFVMIDLDYFKKVNDLCGGHPVGDLVLKGFANFLRLLPKSKAFRVGGEEFLLLVFADETQTVAIISQLLERWKNITFRLNIPPHIWQPSFSAGICGLRPGDMMAGQAWSWADKALYAAKQTGRGKIVCCEKSSFRLTVASLGSLCSPDNLADLTKVIGVDRQGQIVFAK